MIFSIGSHIYHIMTGYKTQTRRPTDRYDVGKTYAVQAGRGKSGIPEGRILITRKWEEFKWTYFGRLAFIREFISKEDALAEGFYKPKEYEELYDKMYPSWKSRWVYEFEFHSSRGKANE